MKSIHQYLEQNLLLTEFYNFNGDVIITESFISRLAKLLGSKARKLIDSLKDTKKDLVRFPEDVKKAFNGFTANIANPDDKLQLKQRQEIVERVSKTKIEDITDMIKQYYSDNKNNAAAKNSPMVAYLYALGVNVAKANNDKEGLKEMEEAFRSIPNDVKKKAADFFKQEVSNNDNNEEQQDNSPEAEKTKEEIEKVVQQEEIAKPAKEAGLELKTLTAKIYNIISSYNEENTKASIENSEEFKSDVTTIAQLIIDAKGAYDSDTIKSDALKKYGIDVETLLSKLDLK